MIMILSYTLAAHIFAAEYIRLSFQSIGMVRVQKGRSFEYIGVAIGSSMGSRYMAGMLRQILEEVVALRQVLHVKSFVFFY